MHVRFVCNILFTLELLVQPFRETYTIHIHTYLHACRHACMLTDRQTDRLTYVHIHIYIHMHIIVYWC